MFIAYHYNIKKSNYFFINRHITEKCYTNYMITTSDGLKLTHCLFLYKESETLIELIDDESKSYTGKFWLFPKTNRFENVRTLYFFLSIGTVDNTNFSLKLQTNIVLTMPIEEYIDANPESISIIIKNVINQLKSGKLPPNSTGESVKVKITQ